MVIVDDYSCFIWVQFLRKKSEAFEKFKVFKTMIELQLERYIYKLFAAIEVENFSPQNFLSYAKMWEL